VGLIWPEARKIEMVGRSSEMHGQEPVVIVTYDPEWPKRFDALGAALRRALGEIALRIDHIGSTAVPGLAAKPVIDIQISVSLLEPLHAYRISLEQMGYRFQPDNPDLTKRYFREPVGEPRTHIHVREAGGWPEQLALLFRDYLCAHPKDAERYADLKFRLAATYGTDREGYTEAKGPLIWQIVARAHAWSQQTGWRPGPSGA
jgi:GrpB-like predicted nucleotidyltransferase (UPF0157 family)